MRKCWKLKTKTHTNQGKLIHSLSQPILDTSLDDWQLVCEICPLCDYLLVGMVSASYIFYHAEQVAFH